MTVQKDVIPTLFTKEEQKELKNFPPLSSEEQTIIDILAGLMVDQYYMKIEKGNSDNE